MSLRRPAQCADPIKDADWPFNIYYTPIPGSDRFELTQQGADFAEELLELQADAGAELAERDARIASLDSRLRGRMITNAIHTALEAEGGDRALAPAAAALMTESLMFGIDDEGGLHAVRDGERLEVREAVRGWLEGPGRAYRQKLPKGREAGELAAAMARLKDGTGH